MKPQLVIWGAAGHALIVADIVRLVGDYDLIGFLDDVNHDRHGTTFYGAPILGGQEQLALLQQRGVKHMIFGFGNNEARLRLADVAREAGFELVTAVHPRAVVSASATIGPGAVIAAGAVIGPQAFVGSNAIINTCTTVDHECKVADGAHLSAGVHMGGQSQVDRAAFVGIGTTISTNVTIGAHAFIGAGALVVRDIPERVLAYGAPAKVVRDLP